MRKMSMKDLPHDLVGMNILTRIPITSLKAVRSTCKAWNALSKDYVIGKAEARHQFLGFMEMNRKVYSVRFDIRIKDIEHVSIKPLDLPIQVDVLEVFNCNGLPLCDGLVLYVAKDLSRLVVWNPYLGQSRSIRPSTRFYRGDWYALGYDINRNHKILRFSNRHGIYMFEIYDFSSSSWKVIEPTPKCWFHESWVSLKGVIYLYSNIHVYSVQLAGHMEPFEDILLSFDFTTERFGPRLHLPFQSHSDARNNVTLSCVRQEQLAVLCYSKTNDVFEVWVSTKIEPNSVSWTNFLKVNFFEVETKPLDVTRVYKRYRKLHVGSFFIDEEEKVVIVLDIDVYGPKIPRLMTAFILGEDGFAKSMEKFRSHAYRLPLVCSSAYSPSLVHVTPPELEPAQN